MQFLRSLVFDIWLWVWMAILGIGFLPLAIASRNGAYWVMGLYARHVLWMLEHLCGLRYEVRGTPPTGEVLIAAKHESFIDNIILFLCVPRAKFVMKRELKYAPIFGFYATRIGTTPVARGKGSEAVRSMTEQLAAQRGEAGQIIIYPQGTRVAPGAAAKYKFGAARLYEGFGLECHPVALNTGVFWGRRTLMRYRGTMVIEFLEPIPAGLEPTRFMRILEERIESASERLHAEAIADRKG